MRRHTSRVAWVLAVVLGRVGLQFVAWPMFPGILFGAAPTGVKAQPRPSLLRQVIRLPGWGGIPAPHRPRVYQLLRSRSPMAVGLFDWSQHRWLWLTPVPEDVAPIALSGDVLVCSTYVGGRSTTTPVLGLDRRTGRVRWREPSSLELAGKGDLAVAHGFVVVAAMGHLRCLRAASGKVVWRRECRQGSNMQSPAFPIVIGNTLYTVLDSTHLIALGLSDGRIHWQHTFPAGVILEAGSDAARRSSAPADAGRVVGIVETKSQYLLTCWGARDGQLLWQQEVPGTEEQPVVVDGVVCVIGPDGAIQAHSLQTGGRLWARQLGPGVIGPVSRGHSGALLLSIFHDGNVRTACLRARDASLQWDVRLPGADLVDLIQAAPDGDEVLAIGSHIRGGADPIYWLYRIAAADGGHGSPLPVAAGR
jgi:outer membrane protein assembly factor BamB